MLPPKALQMSEVCSPPCSHVDLHGPCYCWWAEWTVLLYKAVVKFRSVLLQRAMPGVLLQPSSLLLFMACVTNEGHTVVHPLPCCLKPCNCLWVMLWWEAILSEWSALLPEAMVKPCCCLALAAAEGPVWAHGSTAAGVCVDDCLLCYHQSPVDRAAARGHSGLSSCCLPPEAMVMSVVWAASKGLV